MIKELLKLSHPILKKICASKTTLIKQDLKLYSHHLYVP